MKTTAYLLCGLLLPTFVTATGAENPQPALVASGVVSTNRGEYSPTFDVTRQELIFMRRTPGEFDYTLFTSSFDGVTWTRPIELPFSGAFRDAGPSFSPDGDTLVFDSRRPHPELRGFDIDLWKVSRNGDGWGAPMPIIAASVNAADEPDAQRDEFGPVMTATGDVLWYSFRRPDRGGAFYRLSEETGVERVDGLPDPSAATFVAYFTLSADGNTAVLEGRSATGRDSDLYFACRDAAGWSQPQPLETINSQYGDGGPYLTADGAHLFFASDRPATEDGASESNIFRIATDTLPIPCAAP